jgi:hypothetical protein
MPDIDKPVDAAPVPDNPVPQAKPVSDEPAYSDQLPPAGTEDNVNVIAEDSEEADFSKNQEPVLDEEDLEIEEDEDLDLSGPGTEGD